MLGTLQKQAEDDNPTRTQEGYPTLNVIGWAEQPHYDAATHKLYWARELAFGGQPTDTLNYGVRVLGREGTLDLDAISDIGSLAPVSASMTALLQGASFAPGRQYDDYKKGDRTSTLTIAALVAGGTYVAAKTGLIALLLAKGKFIILGIVALLGALRRRIARRFRRGSQDDGPVTAPEPMTAAEMEPTPAVTAVLGLPEPADGPETSP
jgi:uncharacterized membrane-anchored protein